MTVLDTDHCLALLRGHLDLQSARIALEHDVPLVTHNRRHFECVPGLAIEDWLE